MLIHVSKRGPIGAKHTLIIGMVITMFLCLFLQFQHGLLWYAGEIVGRLFTVSGWWCCSPLYFFHCTRPTVARWGYRYGRSCWRASCCRRNDHRGKTILMIIIVFKVFPNKWHQTLPCDVPVSRYIQASSQCWQVGFPHRSRPPRCEPTQTSLQPIPWWRHQMETFSALLALCAGNSPVPEFTGPGEFPAQRPVTLSLKKAVMFSLICRLSKQPWGWWFETLSWSLWRQCNVPDSKFHGVYMGPSWGRQDPGGLHVGHTKLAIWVVFMLSMFPI